VQKHHAFFLVSGSLKLAHVKESFAIPYHVLDFGFFFGCRKSKSFIFLYAHSCGFETAYLIGNDKDRFLRKPDRAFDTTECKSDICLPRCLIRNSIRRKTARTPFHHILTQRLGDEQTPSVTATACATLITNVMDAVNIEAVQVQMLTDFLLLHNRVHFLVASLILALFCIVHKVFAEKLCGDRLFYGSIDSTVFRLPQALVCRQACGCTRGRSFPHR